LPESSKCDLRKLNLSYFSEFIKIPSVKMPIFLIRGPNKCDLRKLNLSYFSEIVKIPSVKMPIFLIRRHSDAVTVHMFGSIEEASGSLTPKN